MEKSIKFLGIMILISSIIISLGGIIENLHVNRYELIHENWGYVVFDRLKGIRYGYNSTPADSDSYFFQYDYPNMKYDKKLLNSN